MEEFETSDVENTKCISPHRSAHSHKPVLPVTFLLFKVANFLDYS